MTTSEQAKINMFDGLMDIVTSMATELSEAQILIENRWVRQSNLIYLLNNPLASTEQQNKASQELGRIQYTRTKQDGYAQIGYGEETYSN